MHKKNRGHIHKGVLGAFLALAVGIAAFFWQSVLMRDALVNAVEASDGSTMLAVVQVPKAVSVKKSFGIPVRIKIPRVSLNAAVEQVALAADGSMNVPRRPKDAAWYALGPRPGETGSAVIAGHVNWLYGATAAFANLKKTKPGDTILVQDDKGVVTTFVVRDIRQYDAGADTTDVFGSSDGGSHLNLVTCVVGVWDKRAKQYNKRLVVFADRKDEYYSNL